MRNQQRLGISDAVVTDIEEYCEAMEGVHREAMKQLGFVASVKGGDETGMERGETNQRTDAKGNLDTNLPEVMQLFIG